MSIDLKEIKKKIQSSEAQPVDIKSKFSVLIPLIEVDGKISILYEQRAETLRNQPGEISFPGGKIEKGESPKEAAIRETYEELLIDKKEIEVYSDSDYLINPSSAIIYSFVGEIKHDFYKIKPSTDEVKEIFTVPLEFFLNNEPERYISRISYIRDENFPYELIPNGKNYKFKKGKSDILFYKYENRIIWGFTAKMTKNFINKLLWFIK